MQRSVTPPFFPRGATTPVQRQAHGGLIAREPIVRPPQRIGVQAQELVAQPGGTFAMRSAERRTSAPPPAPRAVGSATETAEATPSAFTTRTALPPARA